MRLLAAADFHGQLDYYRWFLEKARELGPEALVLAGDLFGFADEATVFVTHSPAHGILDPRSGPYKIGSPSIGRLIEDRSPVVHIHGHSHSGFGRNGRHFNVAMARSKRAILIDLESPDDSTAIQA